MEKQLRQPDIEDDLPWTYSTVTGDKTVALVDSALVLPGLEMEFTPLTPEFTLPVSPESDEP